MVKKLLIAAACFAALPAKTQTFVVRDPVISQMIAEVSTDSLRDHINNLVAFGTRHTLSSTTDPKKGIGAAREWVVKKFRDYARNSKGRMTAYVDTTTLAPDGKRVNKSLSLGNAIAILKGTDTADKRIFLISGHLDNRVSDVMNVNAETPGANDDGSGVAAVIECARVMSRREFPATIIFVAVSGEEQGLLGAGYLAGKARKENWDLQAVLNNDIMGSNHSNETDIIDNTRLRVFSEGLPAFELDKKAAGIRSLGMENDGPSRQLARYVKETGERYVDHLELVMIYRNDRFLRGGDHTPFVQKGFAAVRLTEMNENFNHQHQDIRKENGVQFGDLAQFMDFEYLRKNTAVNLACLANLAASPGLPVDVTIDVKDLTNSTYLSWKKPLAGKCYGYYILMRETTAAQWQKKFFTTETGIRLPYSKDNYFFAVQSVDEKGHESLAIPPVVGR
ncbi:M20/M25/M40 family metallo-hydrolase [Flavihumibacter fluvii]|uniref:M20/M25/M40 family metallo-hydrolase n=1 Tax=Flavihumibacter fluvii TaxID=2838157 RepID=UPI001BDF653A|nr:M20/M25/M40 family metallo-hydrolase [Flavihumibacter fluvii]ULQ52800.1 M20/M25/M40 family metallo-hydrolase [Flavihumibacter fluvii]